MSTYDNAGYTVKVYAISNGEGKFYSSSSIQKDGQVVKLNGIHVAYKQGNAVAVIYDTEDEARNAAAKHADKWIAEHPAA